MCTDAKPMSNTDKKTITHIFLPVAPLGSAGSINVKAAGASRDLPEMERERKHRGSFYLAMEEYVARNIKHLDECFFTWQVAPTVFFGRNQLIDAEVNIDFCRQKGIDMIRRKSGGGCVYADMSNIMFCYINTGWDTTATFGHYLQRTVEMLRSLGVEAYTSERNDVMIDQRKVSGYAFYHVKGRNIVHGTMLYDTDMVNMVSAITPSDQKLVSKGVQSVRQHICLLKDYIGERMSVEQFRDYVVSSICDDEYQLSDDDVRAIYEIEREYLDEAYIYGHNPHCTTQRSVRIEGVGEFRAMIELHNDNIVSLNIMGDFFLTGDLNEMLALFKGVSYSADALREVIDGINPTDYIMGLTREGLRQVIIED